MNPLLLNRDFQLPADGWHQLVPLGTFAHPTGVDQVIDARAVEQMSNRFAVEAKSPNFPGLLIDFDHFSMDSGSASEAAGWVTEVKNRADGLWGKVRWSDSGESAVKGGRYRLVSPVFPPADQCEPVALANSAPRRAVRPLRLVRVALTNDPNLRGMTPLSNRQAPTPADETKPPTNRTMKQVAVKLGLAAEASEEAVLAAVDSIMNRATKAEAALTPLQNRVTALETDNGALLGDVFETKHAARFAPDKKEAAKSEFIKNRAGFEATIGALANAAGADTAKKCPKCGADISSMMNRSSGNLLNRAEAQTPGKAEPVNPRAAAVEEYRLKNRCSFEQAWNAVKAAKPELFAAS
jgi:phage I-like protein